jgi:hypothetical protein
VFFEAGNPMEPRHFASAPGIPESAPRYNENEGFSNPNIPNVGDDSDDVDITDDIIVTLDRYETSDQGTKGNISINDSYFCKSLELP